MSTANTVTEVHDVEVAERVAGIAKALAFCQPAPHYVATTAMNAARARDPKLLGILEQTTETISAHIENTMGDSIRTHTASALDRSFEPTEVGMFRAAYETADKGVPEKALKWIYAAAAIHGGLAFMDDTTRFQVRAYLDRNRLV